MKKLALMVVFFIVLRTTALAFQANVSLDLNNESEFTITQQNFSEPDTSLNTNKQEQNPPSVLRDEGPINSTQASPINGVSDVKTNTQIISLFPNPSNSVITIKGVTVNSTLIIYDLFGVEKIKIDTKFDEEHIDVNNLANGLYFVKVNNNKKLIKFIKE